MDMQIHEAIIAVSDYYEQRQAIRRALLRQIRESEAYKYFSRDLQRKLTMYPSDLTDARLHDLVIYITGGETEFLKYITPLWRRRGTHYLPDGMKE